MPALVPWSSGFLPDPGHQEDVVVDAERHQEHECEQREAWIRVREVEHVVEDQRRHPERRGEGEHHRCDQQYRGDQRSQQQPQHDQDDQQDDRDDQVSVVLRGFEHVVVDGGLAADECVRAG